jgi:hypothetical protein
MKTSACFHLFPAFKYMDLCLHSTIFPRVVHSEDFLFTFLQRQCRIVTNGQDKGPKKIIMMSLNMSFGTMISGWRIQNIVSSKRKEGWKETRLKSLQFWTTSNVKYLKYTKWFHFSEYGGFQHYIRYTKVVLTLFKHCAIFKVQPKSSDSSIVVLLIIWRIFTLRYWSDICWDNFHT